MKESIEGVERFNSPGRGRGLRATKAFKVGDLLFSCAPYSAVLSVNSRSGYCECCFARKDGLAKCGKCKKAYYCNAACQKADWPMHKLECGPISAFGHKWNPTETVRLVARVLAKKKLQKERSSSEKLLLIDDMESHADDVDNDKRESVEQDVACLYQFYSKHLDFPEKKDLITLFSQVECNGFTVEDEELSHMGSAVYPDVALINHSCSPNIIVTYKSTTAEIRAVRDIAIGDEVMISYIDLLYPTADRNERLRDTYYFTCDCEDCDTKAGDKIRLKVRKRSDPIKPEAVSNMIRYSKKIIGEFRAAKVEKTPHELLVMCELSLDNMGEVFDDSNVYVLHMVYQAMGVCIYNGDWQTAIKYGQKLLRPFCEIYPPYSLNVSSMFLKIGRLNMGLEQYRDGTKAMTNALAIMEVAHGKDHPYIEEIKKEMKKR